VYQCTMVASLEEERGLQIECCGIPLKPKYGLTPISCHAVLEKSACAPFIKERRMECINATSLRRKSGQMGHPAFVAADPISKTNPVKYLPGAP
jgi:hypothetical protein